MFLYCLLMAHIVCLPMKCMRKKFTHLVEVIHSERERERERAAASETRERENHIGILPISSYQHAATAAVRNNGINVSKYRGVERSLFTRFSFSSSLFSHTKKNGKKCTSYYNEWVNEWRELMWKMPLSW